MLEVVFRACRDQDHDRAELLALRHQVRVLERIHGQPRWNWSDRLVLAALAPRWNSFLVKLNTLLSWHRQLVTRKWARTPGSSGPATDQPGVPRPHPTAGAGERRVGIPEDQGRAAQDRGRDRRQYDQARPPHCSHPAGGQTQGPDLDHLRPGARRRDCGRRLLYGRYRSAPAPVRALLIHLESRRVVAVAGTQHPDSAWVTQRARNLSWDLADLGLRVRFLIRDRDSKVTESFEAVLDAEGSEIRKTPPRAH